MQALFERYPRRIFLWSERNVYSKKRLPILWECLDSIYTRIIKETVFLVLYLFEDSLYTFCSSSPLVQYRASLLVFCTYQRRITLCQILFGVPNLSIWNSAIIIFPTRSRSLQIASQWFAFWSRCLISFFLVLIAFWAWFCCILSLKDQFLQLICISCFPSLVIHGIPEGSVFKISSDSLRQDLCFAYYLKLAEIKNF